MVKRNPGESDVEFLARFGKDGVLRGRGAITVMLTMTKALEGPVDQHLATIGVKPDGSAWAHSDRAFGRFVLEPPPSADEPPWVLMARIAAAASKAQEE
jgi:hypothetical protein